MNWIIEEAKKSNPQSDRIIVENPEAAKQLDKQKYLKKKYSISGQGVYLTTASVKRIELL